MTAYVAQVQSIIGQAFPERKILVRSNGSVRYISFSPIRQMFMAFALLAFAYWTVHVTARVLVPIPAVQMNAIEIARDRKRMAQSLAEARARQSLIEAQLEERGRLIDAAQRRLEAQHYAVRYLLERSGLDDQRAFDAIEHDKELDHRRQNTIWFWNNR